MATSSTSSISTFMSSFTKSLELARPSRFYVEFNVPNAVLTRNANSRTKPIPERLKLRCETAELPGKSFMTHDLKIYGPTEKFPYQHQYNDLNFTFIVSGDMLEKEIFDDWMDYISPSFINPPLLTNSPALRQFGTGTFDFKYRDEYVSSGVKIYQLDSSNEVKYTVTLEKAYPIAVNQLDLDWSSDGHHKLNVTFAYSYWSKTAY